MRFLFPLVLLLLGVLCGNPCELPPLPDGEYEYEACWNSSLADEDYCEALDASISDRRLVIDDDYAYFYYVSDGVEYEVVYQRDYDDLYY